MSETQQAITALDTLVKQNGALIEELQSLNALKDAHVINNISLVGYVFIENYTPTNPGGIIFNRQKLQEVYDEDVRVWEAGYVFYGSSNILSVSLPNLESFGGDSNFYNCGSIRKLSFPKITSLTLDFYTLYNANNLIDVEFGERITANTNINGWNPANALKSDSTSLVDAGETFTSNLEKLLYNIRNHIAANLPDRTGQTALTITFHANVKSAINADTATAQAFSNKNWTIA